MCSESGKKQEVVSTEVEDVEKEAGHGVFVTITCPGENWGICAN